jgi:hypothetical protein
MTPERRVLGSLGGYRDSDLGASAALRLTGLAPSRPASSSTLNAHSISRRILPASLMSPKRKSETLSAHALFAEGWVDETDLDEAPAGGLRDTHGCGRAS